MRSSARLAEDLGSCARIGSLQGTWLGQTVEFPSQKCNFLREPLPASLCLEDKKSTLLGEISARNELCGRPAPPLHHTCVEHVPESTQASKTCRYAQQKPFTIQEVVFAATAKITLPPSAYKRRATWKMRLLVVNPPDPNPTQFL